MALYHATHLLTFRILAGSTAACKHLSSILQSNTVHEDEDEGHTTIDSELGDRAVDSNPTPSFVEGGHVGQTTLENIAAQGEEKRAQSI